MSYAIRIYPEQALAVLTFTGEASGQTFTDSLQELLEDPAWRREYDRVWNGLGITKLDVSHPDVKRHLRMASEVEDRVGMGRVAVVVSDEMHFMLSRIYQLVIPWEALVFQTMDAALDWLGKTLSSNDVLPPQAR